MPLLDAFQKQHRSEGLEVIAISCPRSPRVVGDVLAPDAAVNVSQTL